MTKRARPYNRDTAIDAAMNLFWAKGYHATSLKDLEGALNMKPGSIYAAFSSKEQLYRAALERYFLNEKKEFQAIIENGETPINALSEFLRSFGQNQSLKTPCNACMLIKTLLGEVVPESAIGNDARLYLDEMKSEFAIIFERAKTIGELPSDINTARLATRYQSNITALMIELERGTSPLEISALTEDMVQEIKTLRMISHS